MSSFSVIQENLILYGMTTYLILGILGNIFNIVIFLQRSFKNNSCSLYLLVASMINIFIISFGVLPTLYSLSYVNPETYSIAYCKIRSYLLHSALMISRSLIVLACIDRFAVCSVYQRIHSMCRRRKAIYLILFMSLTWLIVTSHILVLSTIQAGKCDVHGTYSLFHGIYSLIVAGFLPPVSMIIFGILTIYKLHQSRARVRSTITRISQLHRNDYYLLVMLISEVIVYLISTLPHPIHTLYMTITRDTVRDHSREQIESFVTFLTSSFLIYINSAATFYIHICTSPAYRRQCRQVIANCWMKMRRLCGNQPARRGRGTHSRSRQQQITFV